MAFCNYGPACLFTACFHSSMSGDAALCAASINCAQHSRTHRSSTSPHRVLCLPTTKGNALSCLTTRPATHPLLSLALPQDHNSIQSP